MGLSRAVLTGVTGRSRQFHSILIRWLMALMASRMLSTVLPTVLIWFRVKLMQYSASSAGSSVVSGEGRANDES